VKSVLAHWAFKAPAAAAAWATTQPEDAAYLPLIAATWALRDRAGALHWAENRPPGDKRDVALVSGAQALAESDTFAAAAEWIARIDSAEKRDNAYYHLAQCWLRSEPESGRIWLERAPLAAHAKVLLLGEISH
jgi:hypothetical protein